MAVNFPSHDTQVPLLFAPETYQYTKGHLNESEVEADPLIQFNKWFKQAQNSLPKDSDMIPESTNFSTARLPSGRVSSRIVLLKELDVYGFIVYSNWDSSKKAADFESNKYASLTFFWPHIQRQVRVEGLMETVTRETTQRYFDSRPRGSKIGAWASPQSSVISSRDDLDKVNTKYEEKFKTLKDNEIPCPEYWGGVRIVPLEVEFWQGGVNRLHDRITYRREKIDDPEWEIVRLAP
ncbi:pyridoxiamine phosphate oxidase [Scheffersomyces xylosifermentans]|uniref:pyridoxiamine phosphate oxidase n=1 Tax=Scheffersomyces xylosifermentans TaxID=1304137 RepID=UPI00315D0796